MIRIRINELEPLVSESDFQQVQRMIKVKGVNHWRYQEDYEHRFVYNGFLNCACGSLLYTKNRRDDYYICRDRCGAHYMRKDRIEPAIDKLLTRQVTEPSFLKRHVLAPLKQKTEPQGNTVLVEAQIEANERKRTRIIDGYFEGLITANERKTRIEALEKEQRTLREIIGRQTVVKQLSLETLLDAFAPFAEFDLLGRKDKRRLLNALKTSIIAKDYEMQGLWIAIDGGKDNTHMDTDSSRQPT